MVLILRTECGPCPQGFGTNTYGIRFGTIDKKKIMQSLILIINTHLQIWQKYV